jgi:hypothetical protein
MRARHVYSFPRRAFLVLGAIAEFAFALALARETLAQIAKGAGSAEFPPELVDWAPASDNPVFVAGGASCWDSKIRERGWIMREGGCYHLWYTGYDGTREGIKRLGYATSVDGLRWTRSALNPLCPNRWIEDMMVVKQCGTYYMFAEGAADGHSELFTSTDRVNWKWQGPLIILLADGQHEAKKPCGTPTVWIENCVWYLFYEWHDRGVWLARSCDPLSRIWTNIDDNPVLVPGPDEYDEEQIAVNQIVRYGGAYFAFYHGRGTEFPQVWNTHIARSTDLIHWEKYPGNPIIAGNKSSGIAVPAGSTFRLYTMHDQVDAFYPRTSHVK